MQYSNTDRVSKKTNKQTKKCWRELYIIHTYMHKNFVQWKWTNHSLLNNQTLELCGIMSLHCPITSYCIELRCVMIGLELYCVTSVVAACVSLMCWIIDSVSKYRSYGPHTTDAQPHAAVMWSPGVNIERGASSLRRTCSSLTRLCCCWRRAAFTLQACRELMIRLHDRTQAELQS